ncbi:MAG: NusA-like transcription termination signal-binding factor [Candidatus Thermoplasmatota archaeon]|nr:NusA-like transcription termination signal-binding factor [Candidatus Thermoplasmatota archaeon]
MSEIMFSNQVMQYINMASNVTRADIMDCMVVDDKLIFIVKKGQLGVAIGAKAKNLQRLRSLFKKSIKFVEFDSDREKFIINLCKPYKIKKVEFEVEGESVVARVVVEVSDKSKIIGKDGKNIDVIRKLASRHHSIKDVQIT